MAKILLIDDDADLRHFLQRALEERGHQVACLDRAETGVALLTATGEFDLVLVDENMPGLSGSEFLKVLRKKGNLKDARRVLGVPLVQLTQEKPAKTSALSFQTEALVFIANHPESTVDEIAEHLGCSRSKLYNNKYINWALKSRSAGDSRPPS